MARQQKTKTRRGFGSIKPVNARKGQRFQAFYNDPDGRTRLSKSGNPTPVRHYADQTFETRGDAEAWLVDERRLISAGIWTSPEARKTARTTTPTTFEEYAAAWLPARMVRGRPLAPRTRSDYEDLLRLHILPAFGSTPLADITSDDIDKWYGNAAVGRDTTRARAYGLLRTILGTAVERGLITTGNPAKVRGGGSVTRRHDVRPVTNSELANIVANMPERRRLMIQLAAWCGLRFGELTELRRQDIDRHRKVIAVRRGVVSVRSVPDELPGDSRLCGCRRGCILGPPKTAAGIRDVALPPHLLDDLDAHLRDHVGGTPEALLFADQAGKHLRASAFYGSETVFHATGPKEGTVKRKGWGWFEARRVAGRSNLRFHDLRHTGLTNAAVAGATLAELMQLAGHTTPTAALRYQHAASDRMQDLAQRLSAMAALDT